MDIKEKIEGLRAELHRHNYNYYVLNAPEISDKEFDEKIRELQDLEQAHPEYKDENSPTMRVGSDINKNFTQENGGCHPRVPLLVRRTPHGRRIWCCWCRSSRI